MKLIVNTISEVEVKYLKISVAPRYWDDAEINGELDENGDLTPFRNGDLWEPVIDIDTGKFLDWDEGTEASFHFKVCDAGSYYLLDEDKNVISSIVNDYVPCGLCHGDEGYGDYIIMTVKKDGHIKGYKNEIYPQDWNL